MEQIDKKNHYNSLIVIYGKCLSRKACDDLCDYYSRDLSLAEIAEKRGVSRNAIFMSLHSGEKELDQLEEKIGFLKHLQKEISYLEKMKEIKDISQIEKQIEKMRKDLYYDV
ncbi:MAG: hypothetical protein PHW22_00325 [Bacilli bacterium]|nr:hypothetical protein [Bacilli bacterium]